MHPCAGAGQSVDDAGQFVPGKAERRMPAACVPVPVPEAAAGAGVRRPARMVATPRCGTDGQEVAPMCRWIAYVGSPLWMDSFLVRPENSLLAQSRNATSSRYPMNADGFGIGWYGEREKPGIFHSVTPAWNDPNFRHLAEQIRCRLFLAHVRSATGTPTQITNCHPFRRGNWLFQHNGVVPHYEILRRRMDFAIAPELYPESRGHDGLGADVLPRRSRSACSRTRRSVAPHDPVRRGAAHGREDRGAVRDDGGRHRRAAHLRGAALLARSVPHALSQLEHPRARRRGRGLRGVAGQRRHPGIRAARLRGRALARVAEGTLVVAEPGRVMLEPLDVAKATL